MKVEDIHDDTNCIHITFQLSMLNLSKISMCSKDISSNQTTPITLGEQESAVRSIQYIYPK